MWCVPKIDGEYVARMEDVLDLYAEPLDPARPVVCLDESPLQLIGEVRGRARPGRACRLRVSPQRHGEPVRSRGRAPAVAQGDGDRAAHGAGLRQAAARTRRRGLPRCRCIRVVQDNLSTHTPGSLYEAFPAPEAHRILERLEFHYTPKHASWLNMVEIEIGVSNAGAWTGAATTARNSSARSPPGSASAISPAHT